MLAAIEPRLLDVNADEKNDDISFPLSAYIHSSSQKSSGASENSSKVVEISQMNRKAPDCLPGFSKTTATVEKGGPAEKPRVIRIKRKRCDVSLDSLWLETSKKMNVAARMANLSVNKMEEVSGDLFGSGDARNVVSKFLFRRVETITAFKSGDQIVRKMEEVQKRRTRQHDREQRQERILSTSRKQHLDAARNARYKQVAKSRNLQGSESECNSWHLFHLVDLVKVEEEEEEGRKKAERRESAKREAERQREGELLCNFLPLLREHVPAAADKIEASMASSDSAESKATDSEEYVYDVYFVDESPDALNTVVDKYPTIFVEEDDEFDWRVGSPSECDSEDSNDENNPENDYPEEESNSDSEDEGFSGRKENDLNDFMVGEDDIDLYGTDGEEYENEIYDEVDSGASDEDFDINHV